MMEILIAFPQTAENFKRLRFIRFAHIDALETPGKRRVLFNIFAIFLVGRCADNAQCAAR